MDFEVLFSVFKVDKYIVEFLDVCEGDLIFIMQCIIWLCVQLVIYVWFYFVFGYKMIMCL